MNVLFTCVGRRVELIQEFKKCSDEDRPVRVFGTDASLSAPAALFCDSFFSSPLIKQSDYIPFLLKLCKDEHVDVLIPTIDTDLLLLSENRALFEEMGTKVLISSPDIIKKCRDKRHTGELFEKAGLSYPVCTDDIDTYKMRFPAFIKPLNGSSSVDAYRAETMQQLCELSKRVPDYIVQPFIEGDEYTIDIFCDFEGNPIYITPRKRLAVRAGEVLKTEIVQDTVMIDEALRLIDIIKPCGPLTVQLIREKSSGVDWYIEINPRFGGGAPLSIKAGADSARTLIELLSGKSAAFQPYAADNHAIFSRFDQSVRIR